MKFRKKPVVIEAFQLGTDPPPTWFEDAIKVGTVTCHATFEQPNLLSYVIIRTLEGDHRGQVGDWIIQGIKGELYPCKPDIFAATYEPAQP